MSGRPNISAYTPSNTDPELLKRIFVQRGKLLERIVDRLSRSMTTGDKHHILLVGPRGSGKTHLVSLAVWDLQAKQELADAMRIAWLGEDDSFTGLIHLAFGIASQLAKVYPKEFPADFKTSVRGLSPDDAALAVLQSTIEHLGKRNLLLVTENMDQTFHSLGDSGQKKWRAFLQETRKIATLASAQQLFAGVSDRNEAFFGFFDIQHLKPLSVEEAAELISRISSEQSKPELARYLNSAEGRFRIRALHYLAGGNHRMYVLLAEFLTKDSLEDLVSAFENLAHDMTPYFQERVRSLPDQQKQLVQCLCDAEGALTVKEIAGETFIDERICSKQLGNLKTKGYVRSEKRGKESYYDMAEPLMRLCLEVKNQRGRPLRLVARFLRAWFPAAVLQTGAMAKNAGRVGEYCAAALESGGKFEAVLAVKLVSQIRGRIKSGELAMAKELAEELQYADAVRSLMFSSRIEFMEGNFDRSIKSLTAIIEMPDASVELKAQAFFNRGISYGQQGDVERELADYMAVIEMADAPTDLKTQAFINRGITFRRQGEVEQALAEYSAVIEMADASVDQKARALLSRGVAYGQQGDLELGLADYSAVIEMADASVDQKAMALLSRGIVFGQQGDLERAMGDYSAVIKMADAPSEHRAMALLSRGDAYGQQDKAAQALADYSDVIKMVGASEDLRAHALVHCGVQKWRDKKFKESAADFEAVLSMPSLSTEQRTKVLFAVVEPMIEYCSLDEIKRALIRAFVEGDAQCGEYGGTPHDLISMVLRRSPTEWANYIAEITPLYIKYVVAEKLGQGVTKSIQHLDEGGFSKSQIDSWNAAWQQAGKGCEDLEIPLRCLDAAVEVMKSDPPTDRPLFRLPLEIRGLIRPLLNRSLGEE
jgi:tetratricopeptide (TPR) repeat protein